jgi:hypothetical protein
MRTVAWLVLVGGAMMAVGCGTAGLDQPAGTNPEAGAGPQAAEERTAAVEQPAAARPPQPAPVASAAVAEAAPPQSAGGPHAPMKRGILGTLGQARKSKAQKAADEAPSFKR